jgi:hypothetical protein
MELQQIGSDALSKQALGEAVRPARRAYVFSHRIASLVLRDPPQFGTAVGIVAAHEIGHLLLPSDSHASSGVMQSSMPLNLIVPERFREGQAAAIRIAFGSLAEEPT